MIVTPGWRLIGDQQDLYMDSGEDMRERCIYCRGECREGNIMFMLFLSMDEVFNFWAAKWGRDYVAVNVSYAVDTGEGITFILLLSSYYYLQQ